MTPTTYQEPPHPTQVWQVTGVRPGKVSPNPKGQGNLQAFYCDMEGTDDGYVLPDGAYWRRKEGNAPAVGDKFLGTVSVGDYGLRFTWDNKGQADAVGTTERAPAGTFESAAGSPAPGGENPSDRQRSIVRQHSEGMALQFLAIAASEKDNQDRPAVEFTTKWLEDNLMPIINFFVADANGEAMPANPDDKLPF